MIDSARITLRPSPDGPDELPKSLERLRRFQARMQQARAAIDAGALQDLWEPFDRLLAAKRKKGPDQDEEDPFRIPLSNEALENSQQGMMALLAPYLLSVADELWEPGSWPGNSSTC